MRRYFVFVAAVFLLAACDSDRVHTGDACVRSVSVTQDGVVLVDVDLGRRCCRRWWGMRWSTVRTVCT